jgi:DNA-binding ferritin-like protein
MARRGHNFAQTIDQIAEKVIALKEPIHSLLEDPQEKDQSKETARAMRKLHQLLARVDKLEETLQTVLTIVTQEKDTSQSQPDDARPPTTQDALPALPPGTTRPQRGRGRARQV